ncbi:hypothetical protein [Corynebacterium cystitidis]|uniref:hypothetical protein n=1 Tax=Corynebacterium cystitidis TaxID=35757 RepID=UPI00211E3DF5|nr:hypothetical protein [Corynebacterium cystitidis]
MANITLNVDGSIFTFHEGWLAEDFDSWFGKNKGKNSLSGSHLKVKDCDLLAVSGSEAWLIEAKDYTYKGAKVPRDLGEQFARKIFDTLARLLLMQKFSHHEKNEFAKKITDAKTIHVCLAVELPDDRYALSSALMALKEETEKAVRPMGITRVTIANSKFPALSLHKGRGVPWERTRDPQTRKKHQ